MSKLVDKIRYNDTLSVYFVSILWLLVFSVVFFVGILFVKAGIFFIMYCGFSYIVWNLGFEFIWYYLFENNPKINSKVITVKYYTELENILCDAGTTVYVPYFGIYKFENSKWERVVECS